MVSPEHVPEAPTTAEPAAPAPPTSAVTTVPRHAAVSAATWFGAALLICLLAYVALTVPGSWFPGAATKRWAAGELSLARGSGTVVGGELVVTDADTSGIVLVSVNSDLRASDYA